MAPLLHFRHIAERAMSAKIQRKLAAQLYTAEPADQSSTPDTSGASGIPLQIVAGGHPIISMQRRAWKPDRIAE